VLQPFVRTAEGVLALVCGPSHYRAFARRVTAVSEGVRGGESAASAP
jgi:hypothetical protein